jgi:sulfoxide reductase heme-binding subunit YedZ
MHIVIASISIANLAATPLAATTANPLLWYVTRAAAVSAYVTLTATAALGIIRSLARAERVRVTWMLDEAHQVLALLTAAFVALHLLALVFDPLIPFSLLNLLLPIAEPYRPFAVDLGVLALYGLVIVLASSWLRRLISHARWRALHYTSFVVFALVTFHGILAGSDAGAAWMRLLYLAGSGAVTLLALARLLWSPSPAQVKRMPTESPGAPWIRPRALP